MADYNPNILAAYKQYGQSMMAGGGGSNLSGTGARTASTTRGRRLDADMAAGSKYAPTIGAGTSSATQTGLGSPQGDKTPPAPTTPEDKTRSFYNRVSDWFNRTGATVTTPYTGSVDPTKIYNSPAYTYDAARDYVYRADRNEAIETAIAGSQAEEQAQVTAAIRSVNDAILGNKTDAEIAEAFLNDMGGMGNDKPDPLGSYGVPGLTLKDVTGTDEGALSNPQALYDMADEFANPSITTTELPSMSPDEQAALGAAIRKAAEEGTLSSMLTNIQNVRFDEAQARRDWAAKLFPDDVNPETGEQIVESSVASGSGLMSRPTPSVDDEEQGPVLYPSNTKSVKTYAQDTYPDNPEAAAALAATIESEGMYAAEENIGKKGDYKLTNVIKPWMKDSKQEEYRKRTSAVHAAIGLPIKKDKDGNNVALTKPEKEINTRAQTLLNNLGYDVGAEDGIVGKNTTKGIKEFQSAQGLPVTGKLDNETLSAMNIDKNLVDHKGNPLYVHDDSKAPKYIPGDKAEEVFNIFYNDYYRTANYKLGNEGADVDAGKYIGRGPVQITGKEMYKKIGDAIGVDLINNPELVATDPSISKAATKAYLDMKGFDKLSPEEAIKIINPGMGQDKVGARMELYNKYLKEMQE